MILDASAILAVLLRESEHEEIFVKLGTEEALNVGAPTLVEVGMILTSRLGDRGTEMLRRFLQEGEVTVLPFRETEFHEAVEAFRRFGKGRHPAALNFGDCMAYATARLAGQRLLCRGDDFPQTDLELA